MFLGYDKDGDAVRGLHHNNHNGDCCGISHLYDFPSTDGTSYGFIMTKEAQLDFVRSAIKGAIAANREKYGDLCKVSAEEQHHAIEVVLVDGQFECWAEVLAEIGFKEVWSFLNSNSNNRCHIFYLETNA